MPIVYSPMFSLIMFRLLLATNPHLLKEALREYSLHYPPPTPYHGLASTKFVHQYPTLGIYGYSAVNNLRDAQPFVSTRIEDRM
jgi:hypothetical protein